MNRSIVVLDFGGQYAHLIANRIRRLGAYSEIYSHDVSAEELKKNEVAGIILSGGPKSVYAEDGLHANVDIFDLDIPVLGICYGHQLLVHALGGEVEMGSVHEFGKSDFVLKKKDGVWKDFPNTSTAWMSHVDKVIALPRGFEITGTTSDCSAAAIACFDRNIFGVQFHPEVTHTQQGMLLLQNFVEICGVQNTWKIDDFVAQEIQNIQKQAAGKNVFLLVSGGVDSSVTFALLEKALGKERIYGLFVDHGLMRKDEVNQVPAMIAEAGFDNLHVAKEENRFLKNLEGITDPEEKRMIIGNTFLDVQEQVTTDLDLHPDEWLLGQGTIYPDTIESGGTKHAAKIKTHHNRVERVQKLIDAGKIIEPLKDLYKDEVREVGLKLGLPKKMIERHPFPGPGLGVRILCSQNADSLPNTPEIESGIQKKFADIEARVLPLKSVGVQGDFRSYRHPVVLFSKNEYSWDTLDEIATNIPNSFPEINRVLLSLSHFSKLSVPKVTPSFMTKDRIALLQEADAIIRMILEKEDFKGRENIWQFPVVLCPLEFGEGSGEKGEEKSITNYESSTFAKATADRRITEKNREHTSKSRETIILRPVESQEAMTASFARIPGNILLKMSKSIMNELEGKVSAVFFDITNKPPGTIEWE